MPTPISHTRLRPSVRLSTIPSSSYGYSTCALQQVVRYRRRQRYITRRATNNKVAQEQESHLSTAIPAHQFAALPSAGRGSGRAGSESEPAGGPGARFKCAPLLRFSQCRARAEPEHNLFRVPHLLTVHLRLPLQLQLHLTIFSGRHSQ